MKPYIHAQSSARRFGGKPEDYLAIHDWFDETKAVMADSRHRALRHHAEGIFLCERVFGHNVTNSDGNLVSVRDIGEQHVLEDFANRFIPSVQDYLQHMVIQDWMVDGRGAPPSYANIQDRLPKETKPEVTYDGARPLTPTEMSIQLDGASLKPGFIDALNTMFDKPDGRVLVADGNRAGQKPSHLRD